VHRTGLTLLTTVVLFFAACAPPSTPRAPGAWIPLNTDTGDAFYSVNFVDRNVGWLNGHTDRDYLSEEENQNANKNAAAKPAKKTEVSPKANQGFEVLQTTDGGDTWRPIPGQFKHKIRSVWFVDASIGWALTINRDLLHTTDGGASWALQRKAGTIKLKLIGNRRQPEMDQPDQIEHVYFIDKDHGWAWGGGQKTDYADQPGIFLATIDGGKNWNEIAYPFEQNVTGIFFLDAARAWASTSAGFYETADGGLNWNAITTKRPEDAFNSIFFLDEKNGWVVGRSGRLAKTTDGGRTWTKLTNIKPQFVMKDIVFTDRARGWAAGDDGALLYTPDGGRSWINVSAPVPAQLTRILFREGRGWAVGLGGAVLRFEPGDG